MAIELDMAIESFNTEDYNSQISCTNPKENQSRSKK